MAANIQEVTLIDRGRAICGSSQNGSYWTDNVTCSAGDTTVTINSFKINADSAIDPYCETVSGKPVPIISIVSSYGTAILTFPALIEAANIKLNILDTNIDDLTSSWSTSVNAALGATSVTISDNKITSSSIVKIYAKNASGKPITYSTITVTTGQVVVAFDALEEATTFIARIFNL